MSQQPWDASQGANPDTCLHFLAIYVDLPNQLHICISCESTLSEEYLEEFVWDYEHENGVYHRRSVRASRRALSGRRHPLLGVRDRRKFKIFRSEFPAIFRFNGRLFEECFDIDGNKDRFVEITPEYAQHLLETRGDD
jgi:hypothetical protein